MSDKLRRFFEEAAAAPVELTVRDLLAKWDVKIRNFNTVPRITADLAKAGLMCDPVFDEVDLNTVVCISAEDLPAGQNEMDDQSGLSFPHAALLFSDITSANHEVTSIPPDATLAQARAVMMDHGYSQLPVITDAGALVGAVSWERIGHIQAAAPNAELSDVIDRHPNIVKINDDLLKKIPIIYESGFVLVRDHDDDICGIVTTADLTEQFRLLAEPFFLIGEIERRIRRCIDKTFSAEDFQCVGKSVTSANDMTFGQYVRFLRTEGIWPQLGWQIDCNLFTERLDHIRQVRNEIMHFRPDPLTSKQRERLQSFTTWMRHLDPQL
ncbi:CBS domain-containing protein [Nonomuraea fuscirosea]|uniref:CBS domain-containing protein n=1 Tax=Nonomuraea fuscirosea TaxID=1291556 RepID=UPI0033E074FE